MITQIVLAGITAATGVALGPAAIDLYNDAVSQQTQNVLISDASTIGQAAMEEALLSDSGNTYPAQLTRTGSRISELPSIHLGNVTATIRYRHEADRVWVETCGVDGSLKICAIFDNEASQQITVFKNGIAQTEAVAQ